MNKILYASSYIPKKITKRFWLIRTISDVVGKDYDVSTKTEADLEKTRHLLNLYGRNTASYLLLEDDKQYFFGSAVEGVIGYGIVADVAVVHGDPVCVASNFKILLEEFKDFCILHGYSIIFLNTTPEFLKCYRTMGFAYVKSGDEARFDLNQYNLSGGRAAKIRASVNHARKTCTVFEYKPLEKRNYEIEQQIETISQEWFRKKKTGELIFSLGSIGLDNPMDKRYFYAVNSKNAMVAFSVFVPFITTSGIGYMADVTRRNSNAPGGTSELILYEAFRQFKTEGIRWGSLGIAPLANVTTDNVPAEDRNAVKVFRFIYEKMNAFYGFKNLLLAKKEYAPTFWEPNFFVYWPRILSPHIGYAIVTMQNPGGIADYAKAIIKKKGN